MVTTRNRRFVFFSVSLISTAAIGYEILLMRLLSIVQWHHFAYMVISLALLGYGASGTFIALSKRLIIPHFALAFSVSAALFSATMIICFALGQLVPFNALEIVWNSRQLIYLSLMYLVFFVPFFFAAGCIGLAFTCLKEHISRIYFFDLLGAGSGALLIIVALFLLSPQNALLLLAVIALAASALVGRAVASPVRNRLMLALGGFFISLLLLLPTNWPDFRISQFKGQRQALQVIDARVLGQYSSPLGLLTVVDSPTIPFRDAPGLSLNTQFEPPAQLALFTDGDAMSVITRFDGNLDSLGYMDDVTAALPYRLLDEPRVLVLGAGGGTDVLFAVYHGARAIDAVELNPLVTKLVSDTYADFAGHLYDDDRITVYAAEARSFVTRSASQYDLIQVALLDSFAASGAGVQALSESYLYTVEAIGEYLRHVAPGGYLAITRWLKVPPRDSLKLFATVTEALKRDGAARPERSIALIRSWNTSTLLVKKGNLSSQEIETIKKFCDTNSFDTSFYPSMTAIEANRYNLLSQPFLFEGATALSGQGADEYLDRYKFQIEPATDDKPYFFHFFKWRTLSEMLSLRKRGGAGLIEWGYLVLVATLIQAILAGAVLILFPLWIVKRRWPRGTGTRMGVYFFILGLAFMFVEMAFIQKFILFLGHPLYSVAIVLSGFLVFAGLGSGYSQKLVRRYKDRRLSLVAFAVTGILSIALVYLFLLPELFDRFIGQRDVIKILIALILIAPLAFCMGMPFPIALGEVARNAPDFIPWAWGINGYASVVSASLGTLLAIEFGFTVVILSALGLYTLAAVVVNTGTAFRLLPLEL
ncbi:MAG: SAM-dependent methyltransferase [Gammaproteobacteria bacterium]|nr:SAM-dependent methyltransferase [Gammaproteobacteria bacterium]